MPSLRGCHTQGKTLDELLKNVKEAIELCLEVEKEVPQENFVGIQQGSHNFFRHHDGRSTVVPFHSGRDTGRGLLRKIINETEVSREEFLRHA